MKKKIIAMMTACLMLINLTGCQSTDSNVSANTSADSSANVSENVRENAGENVSEEAGAGSAAASPDSYTVEEKTAPLYIQSADNKQDIRLYFINNGIIPYISAADISDLLKQIYYCDNPAAEFYKLDYATDGDHAVISRGAYYADIDCSNDTITFADYDAFFRMEGSLLVDMVSLTANTASLYQQSSLSTDRYGKRIEFDLKPYEIKFLRDGDGYYIPLQTVSDVFFSYYGRMALYNGDCVIISEGLDEKLKEIFASGSGEWTEELAQFSYNETCFVLDYEYGLKEQHDIDSFDKLFSDTGLKADFLSKDASLSEKALYELIYLYLGDLHSQFNGLSYLTDRDRFMEMVSPIGKGLAGTAWENDVAELSAAREAYYPDGIPAYEEVGNTAYITFDVFTDRSPDTDYFEQPTEADNSDSDTVRLMQYSCQQILREDSPVENVVMDLSINGGGDTGTAEYVMALFLGQADLSAKDTLTGAMTDAVYTIDTNLDGKFDESDTLAGKGLHLFCLESPVSFSCGNLVPNAFKASHKVTILGQESGGGSCAIHPLCTAGGSQYQVSGFRRFSIMKNGSFYDVDRGAEPDYFIGNINRLYDRKNLTEYINSLN